MPNDPTEPTATRFYGFDIPRQNWFKMPNDWTDITAEISSIAELKVVEYVLKHTWGYQEYGKRKRITNDEFMHGRRRKDGTRIDKGTGLSKPSVIAGLKSAVDRGLLIEEVDDSDKARVKKYYSLRMQEGLREEIQGEDNNSPELNPDAGEKSGGVKDLNAGVKNLYPEVKNFYPRGKESLPRTEKDTLVRNIKQETNNNNNIGGSAPDSSLHPNAVVVVLTSLGIAEKVAQKLVTEHSEEYIREKIDFLEFLQTERPEEVQKPAGWLRKAIEDNYGQPDGYQSPEERMAEVAAEQRRNEAMQRSIEQEQRRQEEERDRRRQEADARLAQLQAQYGTTQHELDLWQQVLSELRISLPSASFQAYIANTVLLSLKDNEALIGLANLAARDWVENRLAKQIQRILASHLGGQKVRARFTSIVSTTDPTNSASA